MAKIEIFVDEANLYERLKARFLERETASLDEGRPIKCVVDPRALVGLALQECVRGGLLPATFLVDPELRTVVCSGIPQIPWWPATRAYGTVKRTWEAQSDPAKGVLVEVQDRPNHVIYDDKNKPVDEKQDGVDVMLGVELVREAIALANSQDDYDVLILLSGDSDLGHAAEVANLIRAQAGADGFKPFITVGWKKPAKGNVEIPFRRLTDEALFKARIELDLSAWPAKRTGHRQRQAQQPRNFD